MLIPRSHAWTPLQKRLILASTLAAVVALSAFVYHYERYQRGPDDTVLVGTWRGEFVNALSNYRPGYRFKPDHTFEELVSFADSELVDQRGTWFAGGDFIYLSFPIEMDDGLQSRLEPWHIDQMTPTELQIHYGPSTVRLKRAE